MIGREGMTGLAVFLGTGQSPVRTIVQVPLRPTDGGGALREELDPRWPTRHPSAAAHPSCDGHDGPVDPVQSHPSA